MGSSDNDRSGVSLEEEEPYTFYPQTNDLTYSVLEPGYRTEMVEFGSVGSWPGECRGITAVRR